MRFEEITSRKNPLMQHIRRLISSRSYRRETGEFLGDGVKLLAEAARWCADLRVVVFTGDAPPSDLHQGVRLVRVPEDVMASVSPMETPRGALFLCGMADTPAPQHLDGARYLVLDGVQDPGNLGAIWRTADALGADGLLLVGPCADPWGPKTVRATMGACFRLPVFQVEYGQLTELLARSALPLYASALLPGGKQVGQLDLSRCAVAVGNEGQGVSPQILAMSRETLYLPMRARCESLNAAAAASILLWEMGRGAHG